MDRAKSIVAKLLLHFPPHSRWVVFSSQSQYFAAFLINFSINLAMNFNHRTRQGEPSIVECIGNTKAWRGWTHHSSEGTLACWSRTNIPGLTKDNLFTVKKKKKRKNLKAFKFSPFHKETKNRFFIKKNQNDAFVFIFPISRNCFTFPQMAGRETMALTHLFQLQA